MRALHHLMTLLPYGAYTQIVSQPPAQHVKVDVQLLCNVCMKVEREPTGSSVDIEMATRTLTRSTSPALSTGTINGDPTGPTQRGLSVK